MTNREAVVLYAYTGFMIAKQFSDIHKYIEEILENIKVETIAIDGGDEYQLKALQYVIFLNTLIKIIYNYK